MDFLIRATELVNGKSVNRFHLPREVFLPMLGMGLGIRPLPMLGGLVLLPENRLCVGDVGERRGSAVLGLAERFNGCVDPSSCCTETV